MVCHKEAAFSKRLGNETAIEVIGGADKYVAVCRRCYLRPQSSTVNKRKTPTSLRIDALAIGNAHDDQHEEQKSTNITIDDEHIATIASSTTTKKENIIRLTSPPLFDGEHSNNSGDGDGDGSGSDSPTSPVSPSSAADSHHKRARPLTVGSGATGAN
jgi:hypothetical protein